MRALPLICLLLLINLYICYSQEDHSSSPKRQKRRMLNRRKRIKSSTGRQQLKESTPITAPAFDMPLYNDEAVVHILKAVLGVNEQAPSYNILPVKKGHCTVNGMVMYHNAVWSPKPCITCMCTNGKEVCDEIICPPLTCPVTVTHDGECCPVCSEIAPNDPSEVFIGNSPRTQQEMDELLRREEEEREEEEERIREKRAKKKKAEQTRKQDEQRRLQLEAKEEERKQEEIRKANEEEELRIEEEETRKMEKEQKRKEEEDKREEELNWLVKEKKQREREEREQEEDEDYDDEDESDHLRGDVFRVAQIRVPGSRRPTEIHHPPLPPGCFISEITVSCSNAKLTQIPAISDPEIRSLDLLGNFITSIPNGAFNGLPNLERIDLSKNNLTSMEINTQAFKSLKNLKRLYLDGNLLVHFPPKLPSTLEELKVNDNMIRGIEEDSFKDLKNLATLELEGNLLSEANVNPLAFRPLQSLIYMRLGRNKFRTIPQGLPATIEEIYLENNEIEDIVETAFNHTTNLHTVILRHNKLEEASITPMTWILHENLESLDLSYNKFYHVPSYLPKSLLHLVLVGNQIERIPGYVFAHMNPGLEYLYLTSNKLTNDGIDPISFHGAYHSLREIFLDHNELQSVPVGIEDMKDLHILRLNNNKIRSVSRNCICNEENDEDSSIEFLHLENNFINTREISPYAFSCIRSYSSVILKPQKVK
ncbi:extracellular matrix protein 2 isoform X2 [Pelobates fuscus]|uniref:extracellular matrix protein 2 isoform X2 n=1 Tax=Pelobates fuscus TaxID=191477 RepID=UPI002FE4BC3E